MKTGDARSLNWSTVRDSLDLFCNKSLDYLWKADYMLAPVKQELRQEAVAQGLIHGVSSDFNMPGPGSGARRFRSSRSKVKKRPCSFQMTHVIVMQSLLHTSPYIKRDSPVGKQLTQAIQIL